MLFIEMVASQNMIEIDLEMLCVNTSNFSSNCAGVEGVCVTEVLGDCALRTRVSVETELWTQHFFTE